MIVKLTVNDNDFSQLLEQFITYVFKGKMRCGDIEKDYNFITLGLRSDEKENKKIILNYLKEVFPIYLKNYLYDDVEHTTAYLLSNFKVSIVNIFNDNLDENGECVYYFVHHNIFITK